MIIIFFHSQLNNIACHFINFLRPRREHLILGYFPCRVLRWYRLWKAHILGVNFQVALSCIDLIFLNHFHVENWAFYLSWWIKLWLLRPLIRSMLWVCLCAKRLALRWSLRILSTNWRNFFGCGNMWSDNLIDLCCLSLLK